MKMTRFERLGEFDFYAESVLKDTIVEQAVRAEMTSDPVPSLEDCLSMAIPRILDSIDFTERGRLAQDCPELLDTKISAKELAEVETYEGADGEKCISLRAVLYIVAQRHIAQVLVAYINALRDKTKEIA